MIKNKGGRPKRLIQKPHSIKIYLTEQSNEMLRQAAVSQKRTISNFVELLIDTHVPMIIAEAQSKNINSNS